MQKEKRWTVASAKAHLSEVMEMAIAHGPQVVTRSGIEAVVIVSFEEWTRKTKRTGSLAEFLAASPLRASGINIERSKDQPRSLEL